MCLFNGDKEQFCGSTDTVAVVTACTMQKVGKAPSRTDPIK